MSDESVELEFPCDLTLKIIGSDDGGFVDAVLAILKDNACDVGRDAVGCRPSRNGKYLSVTAEVHLVSRPHLEAVYGALSSDPRVAFVI